MKKFTINITVLLFAISFAPLRTLIAAETQNPTIIELNPFEERKGNGYFFVDASLIARCHSNKKVVIPEFMQGSYKGHYAFFFAGYNQKGPYFNLGANGVTGLAIRSALANSKGLFTPEAHCLSEEISKRNGTYYYSLLMKSNRGFLNFSHNKVTIQAEINPKNPSRKYVSKITGTGVVVSSDNGIYSFLMPVENGTWTVNRFPSMPQDFLRIKSN